MTLQISDLFQRTGLNFDWTSRIEDQNKLIERLKEHPSLQVLAEDFEGFCNGGIASMYYIEYFLNDITKACVKHNISMS